MTVYLVWDGYEDIDAVFLKKENAEKHVEILRHNNPHRHPSVYSILEMEVVDAE